MFSSPKSLFLKYDVLFLTNNSNWPLFEVEFGIIVFELKKESIFGSELTERVLLLLLYFFSSPPQ